jgi:DNA-binding transcriptional ArsR family regulator
LYLRRALVVPKKEGKGKGHRKGVGRRGKARSSQKGATRMAREKAAGIVEPSLSIVVKDPLRVQILALAIQRPISPSEFADESGCPLSVVSYHFRVLRDKGFLELVEKVPVRGSTKHMYRATKSGFISDTEWGQVSQALRPGIAGAVLQDFNSRVTQAMEAGTLYSRDDTCMYWIPLSLDEMAWSKFVEMMAWAIKEAKEYEVETTDRRANGEKAASFPVTFAIAGFESPKSKKTKGQEKLVKGKGKKKTRQARKKT